jgi:nucleoid-associated protein YgaU
MNGLPAGGLSARPIGPTQPATPAVGSTPSPATPATASNPDLNGPRPVAPQRPATQAPTAGGTSSEQVHVVASGDTMSGIAKRYLGKESAWNAIAKANPNVDPSAMKVGTRLRIPAADSAASGGSAASSTAPAATNTTANASGGSFHTVAAGDTLSSISRKHFGDGKHWEKIYEANKGAIGSDPARLKVGQRLSLPKIDGASAR